ncbi:MULTISPECIES: phage terminase small subunit P27 family [unclassified Halomonas]|uniref:phage terminase small subunit P27 family n=1 Tax=unclassified Halomonas TaxID=2609666 RepID=UPI0020A0FF97|nr:MULTISPECIES: phage terminase small subunit P27 family [unclassified Halomonas]MCP1312985.1 phage terminase small subunit P27 family [Halomonas sp. 707D7]MCP1326168.1 phage terminase small subunit P27 family [Halomonas sp. 707D4]
MTRGRKPKPSHLKAVQGNAGKRAVNHDEPQCEELDDVPLPPEWLSPIGIEMWERVAPWLIGSKILTGSDLHNLEAFCAAYSRWRLAEQDIAKNGIVVPGLNSDVKNPACTEANAALKQMALYGSALGLDPSSRSRLAVPGAKDASNPFKDLLGKKR